MKAVYFIQKHTRLRSVLKRRSQYVCNCLVSRPHKHTKGVLVTTGYEIKI